MALGCTNRISKRSYGTSDLWIPPRRGSVTFARDFPGRANRQSHLLGAMLRLGRSKPLRAVSLFPLGTTWSFTHTVSHGSFAMRIGCCSTWKS